MAIHTSSQWLWMKTTTNATTSTSSAPKLGDTNSNTGVENGYNVLTSHYFTSPLRHPGTSGDRLTHPPSPSNLFWRSSLCRLEMHTVPISQPMWPAAPYIHFLTPVPKRERKNGLLFDLKINIKQIFGRYHSVRCPLFILRTLVHASTSEGKASVVLDSSPNLRRKNVTVEFVDISTPDNRPL